MGEASQRALWLTRLGFLIVGFNLFEAITLYSLGGRWTAALTPVIGAIAVIAFFATVGPRDRAFLWRTAFILLSCTVSALGALLFAGGGLHSTMLAPVLINIVLLVVAFRLGLAWIVALVLFCWTGIAMVLTGWIAVAIAMAIPLIMLFINYVFQLFADHRHELARVRTWHRDILALQAAKQPDPAQRVSSYLVPAIGRSVWLFLLPLTLIVLGFFANSYLQAGMRDAAYLSGLILDQPEPAGATDRRELEPDMMATIDMRERSAHAQLDNRLKSAQEGSDTKLEQGRAGASSVLELARPPIFGPDRVCQGDSLKFKVANPFNGISSAWNGAVNTARKLIGKKKKKKKKGPEWTLADATPVCQLIIGNIDQGLASWYNGRRAEAEQKLDAKLNSTQMSRDQRLFVISAEGHAHISESFIEYRALTRAIILVLQLASITSYLFLIGAIFGAFFFAFGRVFYDRAGPLPFSLAGPTNSPSVRILQQPMDQIDLASSWFFGEEVWQPSIWHLCFDAARHGEGTAMDVRFPNLAHCFLQRLLTRRLSFTRVVVGPSPQYPPIISAAGDLKLIEIQIREGLQLVFRMADLIAYSDGIKFRSVYSTHVATTLFGLGAFYCYAEGRGVLILKSDGNQIVEAKAGNSYPTGMLVAWDRCASFRLAQRSGQRGTWLNAPSIVSENEATAIFDEGRPGNPRLFGKLMQLFRYVALPF